MPDLLNQLNDKMKVKGTETVVPSVTANSGSTIAGNETSTAGLTAGDDIIAKANNTKSQAAAPAEVETVTQPAPVVSRDVESLWDEVKTLREENKLRRIREKEMESKLEEEKRSLVQQTQAQLDEALKAQKELEALKAKEEDKKRSLEEKLSHREAMLAKQEAEINAFKQTFEAEKATYKEKLRDFEIQREAEMKIYKEKINEELMSIPEAKRKFAQLLVDSKKEDPREAWAALSEAKMSRLFDEPSVVVSHATPGASTARMTQEKMDAAANDARKQMTPQDKIRAGLKNAQSQNGSLKGKII